MYQETLDGTRVELNNTSGQPMYPFVSVVIPMRNEAAFIPHCLDSLKRQDYPHDRFEVLVVDGRSIDRSRELVTSFDMEDVGLCLLDNPKQIASAGMNIGIRNAQGEIVVILGAHTQCWPDFITQSVLALQRTDADCVGGPIQTLGRSFIARAIAFALSTPFGVGDAKFRYSQREEHVDTVAFPACRRDVFRRVGLFDETLVRNQDIEFSGRLRKSGGRILLTPAIKVAYYSRGSLREFTKQGLGNGYWNIYTQLRNPGCLSLRHLVPLVFVTSLVVAALTAPLLQLGRVLLLSILLPYTLLALLVSLRTAISHGIQYFWVMPFLFLVLHASYGLGSLWGVAEFVLLKRKGRGVSSRTWDSRRSG